MRRGRLRTILQDLPIFLSLNTANIWPELWLPAWDELVVRPVFYLNLFQDFIKKIDLAASLSCLLLGFLSLIRKEVVVDLIKVFQWRVGGRVEGSEVKTGRTGHYYFAQ